ncbi:MAG: hypothetical protein DRN31_04720 [Thermoplasmata archaeon]|nr:MAG: hypothetical protein DRN31_04720 [Thermoplasmata archaeon]
MVKIVCIECPVGCEMTAEKKDGSIKVSGNRCPRGEKYAIQEMTNPRRMLTTTVFVEGGIYPLLPVRSDREIPKGMVRECVKELSKIKVKAPVKMGDVIAKNVCKTGVDIIASRSMVRK